MKPRQLWWVMGALLAAGGCATAPHAPDADLFGPTQPLSLRSDPPGAVCTLSRDGKVLVTVEATPGVAQVPRDFRWSGYGFLWQEPLAEAVPPLEIACRKAGFLEYRRLVRVEYADTIRGERAALKVRPEPTEAQAAKDAAAAAGAVGAAALLAAPAAASGPAGLALAASGGAMLAPAAAVVLIGVIVTSDLPQRAAFAYRPLPEFRLVPALFDSPASRDAFFADRAAKLRNDRDQERAAIDANCWFETCPPTDVAPCQALWCQRLRELAADRLRAELAFLDEVRPRTRIGVKED